jgi:PAS domain S-box-containing protein
MCQAVRARSQAEREIDRFFDLAIDLLGVASLDGYFTRINPACEQILGFTSAEIMAQPFIDFVHPEDIGQTFEEVLPELVKTIEPTYRQVMESGEPTIDLEVTGTNRAQAGVERWWLASFYSQTDDRGRVVGVNDVVQEITERKRSERR